MFEIAVHQPPRRQVYLTVLTRRDIPFTVWSAWSVHLSTTCDKPVMVWSACFPAKFIWQCGFDVTYFHGVERLVFARALQALPHMLISHVTAQCSIICAFLDRWLRVLTRCD